MDRVLGWLLRGFNRPSAAPRSLQRRRQGRDGAQGADAGVYAGAGGVTFGVFQLVPSGFVPAQDKQYLIGFAQLPDGATLDRTEDVIRRMSEITKKQPGVEHASRSPACRSTASPTAPTPASCSPRSSRSTSASADQSGGAIAGQLNAQFAGMQDAFIVMFPPPPVAGLGTTGGFKLQLEDRASLGYEAAGRRGEGLHGQGLGRRRSWPACSPASRSTCRSSMPTSTAPRRASSACR
jgi:multidrug efflux pump